ncbi:MAG: hypothetical protein ACM3S4_03825 [Burkholderiales bacterium]
MGGFSLTTQSGLAPRFSLGVAEYTVVLPAKKSSVSISARAAGYKARVTIDGAKKSSKKVVLATGRAPWYASLLRRSGQHERIPDNGDKAINGMDLRELQREAPFFV